MQLRKSCEHGKYDPHHYSPTNDRYYETCHGGAFLVDDTLVIEKVDGEWSQWALRAMGTGFSAGILDALLEAQGE